MKFTLSWLKDHLETNASPDDISKTLTAIGLEVESITDPAEQLKDFTVARIISALRHPEADKLQVCKVESNAGELQIVCGAPNARAGLFVALAQEGAFIPGANFTIKKTKIRGVESNGMLCSFEELGIPGDSSGIIELPEAPIGSSVAEILGLDDAVIDIAITPNRADCLGVRGIARDLAAAGLGTLKPLPLPSTINHQPSTISVTIETETCQQFIGCHITGVKNAESPDWLKKRLTAIGQKPISALVDITNYFTIDLARPLHVYDAKKLSGNITVRNTKAGEKFSALNDKEYTLEQGMCVIADEKAPVAIGGIMGGSATGCTMDTTDVFLEVALFTPAHVATIGRELQIESEARYRFERSVDPAFVEDGAKLAIAMIQKLCGGTASELVIAGKTPEWKRSIAFNPDRVKTLGGMDIPQDIIHEILASLGFHQPSTNNYQPPSWRADVEGEADLVEEVLRIHGYDNLPVLPLPHLESISTTAPDRTFAAKRLLAHNGYLEVVSYSFIPHAQAKRFGGGTESLQLANPISEELSDMRPSLLPNLLAAAKANHNRSLKNLRLAEVGLTFQNPTPSGQQMVAAGLITGSITTNHVNGVLFGSTDSAVDAFAAKRDMLALLASLGVNKYEITREVPGWYHPGRSGAITLGKKIVLGYFGELHPALLAEFDIDTPAVAFEIFMDAIPTPRAKGKARPALAVSDYQPVTRDFAFVVDAKITSAEIVKAVSAAEKNLLADVRIFDVYAGKGVEDGKKSIALAVTLQAPDRTLSDAEITSISGAITASVSKAVGGVLRA
ncbi:MAG: phenylalanine--tRNA ligase subunit beta [Alphaproteobacteria bacterium]|nr:phenylalanine--tRNA ligase subunit beta [Alphaproteobacteria bacterium]